MKTFTISGRDHVVVRSGVTNTKEPPQGWTVRLLFLRDSETEQIAPFWPLYDYMFSKYSQSDTWQVKTARAIGLLWDYTLARRRREARTGSRAVSYRELLDQFVQALLSGTIRDSSDELGLYWFPQPVEETSRFLGSIIEVGKWIAREAGQAALPTAEQAGAPRGVGFPSLLLTAKKDEESLKGYLNDQRVTKSNFNSSGLSQGRAQQAAVSFPGSRIEDVLWDGFRRSGRPGRTWNDYHVRDMMIFLLQAYAGAREHEPHHLWVVDVIENPENLDHASVALFHPVLGLAFNDGLQGEQIKTTRRQHLESVYGLPPRTHGVGSYRIGWKRSKMIGKEYFAYFYWTDPLAATLFLELFRYYIRRRAAIMQKRRALGLPDHPFLFVSEQENRNTADGYKFIGAPASIGSYEHRLQKAVETCGMTYSHDLGTTSHCLRHFYAYTLKRSGLPRIYLQEGLRHRNPFTSDRYGLPTASDVNRSIQDAVAGNGPPPEARLARTYAYILEKHPEYLGGAL